LTALFDDEIWREMARPRVKPTRSPSLYPTEYETAAHRIAASVIATTIDSSFIVLLPIREATVALPEIESDSNMGQIQDSRLIFGVSIAYLWSFK
jgi:hypothetical protein